MRGLLPTLVTVAWIVGCATAPEQPAIANRATDSLFVGGLVFRDANGNRALEPYEDWRLSPEARAADLVGRMTLEEKAGAMMHGTARTEMTGRVVGSGERYDLDAMRGVIADQHVNSLITRLAGEPRDIAEQNNLLQELAASTRLGIPLTISTDPRNHFQFVEGASVASSGFSQWPEPLGLASIGDTALVRRFGEIVRREYRAVGIHMGLSPQADLATEPRWPRINGTFGEDPELTHDLVKGYVEGFQGGPDGVARDGVALVVKHWVGYGAAIDGFDGHNYYGRFARLDGAFDSHVRPFEGAFEVGVVGVMPTYTILSDVEIDGKPVEAVGGGFNRDLLSLLRDRYGFDGIILSDWAITRDCGENCRTGEEPPQVSDIATPWGMVDATEADRFVRGVEAGLDQFGGTEQGDVLVEAVRAGRLAEDRLGVSVRRVMALKFRLGLFEDPFVDPEVAYAAVGSGEDRQAGLDAQARSLVILENRNVLPLGQGTRVFLRGVDPEAARAAGLVPVAREQAEVAIVRAATPSQVLHPNHFFGRIQHEGRLDFRETDPDYRAVLDAASRVPTVVTVYLDRPAILTNLRDTVSALVGNFGVSDEALLAGLTGKTPPRGRLPFQLPRSMESVEAQSPGIPTDLDDPLYPLGYGERAVRGAGSAHPTAGDAVAVSADLAFLSVGPGRLEPAFDPAVTRYAVELDPAVVRLVLWTRAAGGADVWVDGRRSTGSAVAVPLAGGSTEVTVEVFARDGASRTYTLSVSRRSPEAYPHVTLDYAAGRMNAATMSHAGLTRRFLYYVPRGFDPQARHAIIVGLHGFNHPVDNLANQTYGSMQPKADADGTLLVFPESTGSLEDETLSWNPLYAGDMPIYPELGNVDDVGFITTLIDFFVGRMNADPDRVYVTGTSMGGAMTYALGAHVPGKLAGIAPVIMQTGTVYADLFADAEPLPVMIITGTEDPLVSPDGMAENSSIPNLSQAANVAYWRVRNGASGAGTSSSLPNPVLERFDGRTVDSHIERTEWTGVGGADVVYLRVVRGGHWLPAAPGRAVDPATDMGAFDGRYLGVWNNDFDAAAAIYDFFMARQRDGTDLAGLAGSAP